MNFRIAFIAGTILGALITGDAWADDSDGAASDFGTEAANDTYEMIETVPTPADIIEDLPSPDGPSADQDYEEAGGETTD